jgi:isopentenyldiphosphate isomerase
MTNHVVSEEILDWVDVEDQIIGSIERNVANSDPKYTHREVGVLIVDPDNRVLAQKRAKGKTDPGLWILSAAGHVKKGALPADTAQLELQEELGFSTNLRFIEKTFQKTPTETRFLYFFIGDFPADAEIDYDPGEVSDVKWFTEEEIEEHLAVGENFEPLSLDGFRRFWRGEFETSPDSQEN